MMLQEIPLSPRPQAFFIDLGGITRRLTFAYHDAPEGGWTMDVADANKAPIVCGIPLLPGGDLLDQYAYLGILGRMIVVTAGDPNAVPGYGDLGVGTRLYFETTP